MKYWKDRAEIISSEDTLQCMFYTDKYAATDLLKEYSHIMTEPSLAITLDKHEGSSIIMTYPFIGKTFEEADRPATFISKKVTNTVFTFYKVISSNEFYVIKLLFLE